ncbi:MAG TPA: GNAT family protein [Phycisphaerae bacterium]|nr:GNAT family protein [Phycisphaerae bacterium]
MNIQLARFARADFGRVIQWIGSPEALHEWAGYRFKYPLTEQQLEAHLEEAERDYSQRQIFRAIDADTRLVIGHVELTHIWPYLSGRVARLLVGSSSLRDQGVGSEVLRALLKHGFETFHFDHIDAGVVIDYTATIRCHEQCGFRHVGTWPSGYKSGQTNISVYWMTVSRSEWEQAAGSPT